MHCLFSLNVQSIFSACYFLTNFSNLLTCFHEVEWIHVQKTVFYFMHNYSTSKNYSYSSSQSTASSLPCGRNETIEYGVNINATLQVKVLTISTPPVEMASLYMHGFLLSRFTTHGVCMDWWNLLFNQELYQIKTQGRQSLHTSQLWPIRPGFSSMKRLEVFLLPPGWDASPSQGYPQR